MQPAKLTTRVESFELRALTQLGSEVGHQNARAMNQATYKRLVENIRCDGVVTSAPLVGRMKGDDRLFVISGNHRVAAAIEAGIQETDCILIVDPIPRDRFTAIQLSHNAIEGDDDASILQELYSILGLDLKEYSGLTDDDFGADELSVLAISAGSPLYIEFNFGFLADDAKAVEAFLKSAERWARKTSAAFIAPYSDFERFFDTIVRAKELKGIQSSAIAIGALIELATERMNQLTAEKTEKTEKPKRAKK